jgi:hypothetical protein
LKAHGLGTEPYVSPLPKDPPYNYESPLDKKMLKYLLNNVVPPLNEKPYLDVMVTSGDVSMLSHFGVSLNPTRMILKFKYFFNYNPIGPVEPFADHYDSRPYHFPAVQRITYFMTVPKLPSPSIGLIIDIPRLNIFILCPVRDNKITDIFSLDWTSDDAFDLAIKDAPKRKTIPPALGENVLILLGFDLFDEDFITFEIPLPTLTKLIGMKKINFINSEASMGKYYVRLLVVEGLHPCILNYFDSLRFNPPSFLPEKLDRTYRYECSSLDNSPGNDFNSDILPPFPDLYMPTIFQVL